MIPWLPILTRSTLSLLSPELLAVDGSPARASPGARPNAATASTAAASIISASSAHTIGPRRTWRIAVPILEAHQSDIADLLTGAAAREHPPQHRRARECRRDGDSRQRRVG